MKTKNTFIPSSLHPFLILFLALFLSSSLFAQVPQGIPYQAMIRGNDGVALVNANVTVRFTLHQNTTTGAIEYQETQSLTTNAYGLINTTFGQGTAVEGTFPGINWSNTSKFIQVEANDGTGYVDMGTQQMMSVPYAMYAGSAGQSIVPLGTQTGDMLYWDSASSTWTPLPSGTNGQALYNCEGVPTWGGCAPIVGNLTLSGITPYTAYAEFPMSSNGGNAPTSIGFYLSTSSNVSPSNGQFLGGTWPGGGISNWINSNSASVPGGSGTVKSGNDGATSIANLTPNTQYYLIGAVTNAKGTTATPMLSFNTPVLVEGCMDINACNYNSSATFNLDCLYAISGYNCDGTCATDTDNDGICDIDDSFICANDIDNDQVCDDIDQCSDVNACNYNQHWLDTWFSEIYNCRYDMDGDGFCPVNPLFENYTSAYYSNITFNINLPDGSPQSYPASSFDFCEDLSACNVLTNGNLFGTVLYQDDGINWDGGLLNSFSYSPDAISIGNGFMGINGYSMGLNTIETSSYGCSYDSDDDGLCDLTDKCHDINACNYLNTSDEYCFPDTDNDGVCDNLDGCYSPEFCNYANPLSMECYIQNYPCYVSSNEIGYVDSNCNCASITPGCTDQNACNFNQYSWPDDGTCLYISNSCDDGNSNTINDAINGNCACEGVQVSQSFEVGMSYQGGKIAYIYQQGDPGYISGEIHGFIASEQDLGIYSWGCDNININGAESSFGLQNTADIVAAGCGNAASVCSDLILNGYEDWLLPSFFELSKLYSNRLLIGGFQEGSYWSSNEYGIWPDAFAMDVRFDIPEGLSISTDPYKGLGAFVRPIRMF